MFIVDSGLAERDWAGVQSEIEGIIKRHGGSVKDFRKWDDRRLVYEIKRTRRGTYALVHFEAPAGSMQDMRRDFNLSEKILRQLVVVDLDGLPVGEDRPGITSSPVTDLNEKEEEDHRGPRGRRRERSGPEGETAGVEAV
jgi:ribosomal protein S6